MIVCVCERERERVSDCVSLVALLPECVWVSDCVGLVALLPECVCVCG